MVEYTLHYAGDTFALTEEEAQGVQEALELAATGHGIVMTLVDLDGHTTPSENPSRRRFLISPGTPVYLTISGEG